MDDNEMDTTWMGRAVCADHPADVFFPDQGENDVAQQAKAICATCPVRVRRQPLKSPNSDLKPLIGAALRPQDPN